MPGLDDQIREHAYGVLQGSGSLDDFEAWFVGVGWDDRTRLAASIDHLFAERSAWTAEEVLDHLRTLVSTIEVPSARAMCRTGANSETPDIRRRVEFAGR